MKKCWIIFLLLLCLFSISCLGEENDNWHEAPVITKAYELSAGKLYLEWEGNAPAYQLHMDGKAIAVATMKNAIISLKKGTHTILIYPVNDAGSVANAEKVLQFDIDIIGASIGLDLAALGLNPQNLTAGTSSLPFSIDYTENPIYKSVPQITSISTDELDRVVITFSDRYYADEYVVAIKVGKNVTYAKFPKVTAIDNKLLIQKNSSVSLILDPEFLHAQKCMPPEMDIKQSFNIQLRKCGIDLITGESIPTLLHDSKVSADFQYTPIPAWKTAPIITYASQTADGQITLQWEHGDGGLGCEYAVMKHKKTLGIKTGEEEIARVAGREFIINDLMNGGHAFSIVPVLENEKGNASAEAGIELKNDWVVAPMLSCEQSGSNQVRLNWTAAEGISVYHLAVYSGDTESLLRFVNLDYSLYTEFDVPVTQDTMEFLFTYPEEIDPDVGERLRFVIYGVHYASDGTEQKTAATTQNLVIQ